MSVTTSNRRIHTQLTELQSKNSRSGISYSCVVFPIRIGQELLIPDFSLSLQPETHKNNTSHYISLHYITSTGFFLITPFFNLSSLLFFCSTFENWLLYKVLIIDHCFVQSFFLLNNLIYSTLCTNKVIIITKFIASTSAVKNNRNTFFTLKLEFWHLNKLKRWVLCSRKPFA